MRPIWNEQPKVLAPVGGQPFIFHLLRQLAEAGIRNAVLCTGYLGEKVKEALGDSFSNVRLTYSQEEKLLGTAGALRLALPYFKSDSVLIMNGDSYCPLDLRAFIDSWNDETDIAIALGHSNFPESCGRVVLDSDGRINHFSEKETESNSSWVNAGIYRMKTEVLKSVAKGTFLSLEKDLFPQWVKKGIRGYLTEEKIYDIGTPESYQNTLTFFEQMSAL